MLYHNRKPQSGHPKKPIGKLKSAKAPKQSTKEAKKQAEISECCGQAFL